MADELPCAAGDVGEDAAESSAVEASGGGDAEGSVGGEDGSGADLGEREEAGVQLVEEAKLKAAEIGGGVGDGAPGRLEGITDSADTGAFGDGEEGACDLGEDVGVLVGVDVRGVDAVLLEAGDLGVGFAGDVGG